MDYQIKLYHYCFKEIEKYVSGYQKKSGDRLPQFKIGTDWSQGGSIC